jgi:high-affinity iron transporter
MVPTFVITLREVVEASLIVGIIAAFLVKEGRRDALRQMWIGVAIAVVLCAAVGIALNVVGEELPQQKQEGLETIIGLIAVSMITYMIVWMARHSRGIKAELEGGAASALATGSALALVGMAFLAVLREGFETSVFLLAAFQDARNTTAAGAGAVLGVICALLIGLALYRGGVRINLSRFFRITGLVLVFVAAGLLATAAHTAHGAGWLSSFQGQAVDLSWLVRPGTVTESLLTGMLGLRRTMSVAEVVLYLGFAIPMGLYVVWPRRAKASRAVPVSMALGLLGLFVAGCGGAGEEGPKSGSKTLSFKLTDAGCAPHDAKVAAGPVEFHAESESTSVTEIELLEGEAILGEKENLTEGLSGSFSLNLGAGEYTLRCNGGSEEDGTLTVSGRAPAEGNPRAAAAVADYRGYLERNADGLLAATKPLAAAVIAGDVAKAKALYPATRVSYERIEPVAGSFGDLDPRIDARENDVSASEFRGLHRLEKALWKEGTTGGMAPVARELVTDVEDLAGRVRAVKLQAVQIANGANELLNEVSATKITGEEERYSHIDLVDFKANVEGSEVAFEDVEALLGGGEAKLTAEVETDFAAVYASLEPYERGDGFVPYTALTEADTRKLARGIDRLAEQLSQLPAKIAQAEAT